LATIGATTPRLNLLDATAISSLSTNQLRGLTTTQVRGFTSTQVGALSTSQVGALGTTQLAVMTATQVGGLTGTQVGALTPTQFGFSMIMQSGAYLIGALIMRNLLRRIEAHRLVPLGLFHVHRGGLRGLLPRYLAMAVACALPLGAWLVQVWRVNPVSIMDDGRNAAEASRTSVVFPLPFGPRIPVIVPASTARLRPTRIGARP
jgi:hypothetical protein